MVLFTVLHTPFEHTLSHTLTQTHTHIMYVNTTAHTRQEGREKEGRGCCSTTYAMHVCVHWVKSKNGWSEAAGIWWSQESTSEITDFGWTRPPDGVSSAVIILFPPTCSLGTLLTFQWQGCLLCIVLTSDAGHYQTDRDILD